MAEVQAVEGADSAFRDEPGKTLADFVLEVAPPEVMAKWAQEG